MPVGGRINGVAAERVPAVSTRYARQNSACDGEGVAASRKNRARGCDQFLRVRGRDRDESSGARRPVAAEQALQLDVDAG